MLFSLSRATLVVKERIAYLDPAAVGGCCGIEPEVGMTAAARPGEAAPSPHPLGGAPPTFRGYLDVLLRRKLLVLLVLVLVPALAVGFSIRQQPLYQGSAEVLLGHLDLATALTGIPEQTQQDPQRVAETQAKLARVPTVAERTLRAAGLRHRTVSQFLENSSVSTETNSDLLTFTVNDPNRQLAASLASTYAREYTAFRRELDTGAIEQARTELEARIAAVKATTGGRGSLYANLVANDEKLRTMQALLTANASVVRAEDTPVKIRPEPIRMGIFGLGLGFVLAIGLAFVVEAVDTRVREVDEIGERLGLPLLARLPGPRRRRRTTSRLGREDDLSTLAPQLVMLDAPAGAEAEGFRILRTNLDFANAAPRAQCIMVTSALEGEGKSQTAANLALAFARSGRRVALVDLDLRRSSLHRLFGLRGDRGVAAVAAGEVRLDEALVPIPLGRDFSTLSNANGQGGGRRGMLEVLPAGAVLADAGEFVGTEALGQLLLELRERADLVLVDTPALLRVGDAMALSTHVDALLVVVRFKAIRRPVLKELRRVLDACPRPKLGYVVTDADDDLGYGYGYGAEPAPDAKNSWRRRTEAFVSERGQGRSALEDG